MATLELTLQKYGRLSSIPFLKSSISFHSDIFHVPYRNFRSIPFHFPFHFIPCPGHRTASNANILDDLRTFHYNNYFVLGGIRTCFGVSVDPMILWISSNSCPLNLLLVRSHQAEIIIVMRLIQGRNNVTRVRVELRPFDQSPRKNDAFTPSATLPTKSLAFKIKLLVSKPQVLKNCPVLGSRTSLVFELLKVCWKTPVTLQKNFEDFLSFPLSETT